MTREDAIKTLKELWRETNDPWYEEVYNMAINALEADRKDEPQTIYYPQVDGITPSVIVKNEPQICSVSGRPYTDCCNCEYFKCIADEPQTYGYMTTEQTTDYRKMLDNVQHEVYGNIFEDEPQIIIGERFPSYITENNAQVLDGWQANPRTSTTAVENES